MTSAFRCLSDAQQIRITFDGRQLDVPADASVAAALLSAGVLELRHTAVSGTPRAPYCMMGVCFECLVEIDGRPNRQACLVAVRPGMAIRSQDRLRSINCASAGACDEC